MEGKKIKAWVRKRLQSEMEQTCLNPLPSEEYLVRVGYMRALRDILEETAVKKEEVEDVEGKNRSKRWGDVVKEQGHTDPSGMAGPYTTRRTAREE